MEEALQQQAPRKPAIRTMKSDAEELLKSGKQSLVQIIARSPEPLPLTLRSPKRIGRGAILTFAAVILLAGVGAALIFSGGRTAPGDVATQEQTPGAGQRLVPPPAYFATETSRTITVKKQDRAEFLRLMQDAWREQEREGTIKRLAIRVQDGPQERFITPEDFFGLWRITPPAALTRRLDPNLMVFIYHGESGNRLGLAVRTREPERTFADMLSWESSTLATLTPLFFDERPELIVAPFEDRTWRNIDWRYLKLSAEKDLGIGYAVFPAGNVFLLTTGKEAMETAINRLFAQ